MSIKLFGIGDWLTCSIVGKFALRQYQRGELEVPLSLSVWFAGAYNNNTFASIGLPALCAGS
jgi:hypothetical protein